MAHWPWWLGGPALAAVALGHVLLTGRALGVSGIYRRLASWRAELEVERSRAELARDADAAERALLEATAEEAGVDPATLLSAPPRIDAPAPARVAAAPAPLLAQAIFLGAIVAGGWLAHLLGAGAPGDVGAASPALPGIFLGAFLGRKLQGWLAVDGGSC